MVCQRGHGFRIQRVVSVIADSPAPDSGKIFRIEGVTVDFHSCPGFRSILVVVAPWTVVPAFGRRIRWQRNVARLALTVIPVPARLLRGQNRGKSEYHGGSHNHDKNSTSH